MKPSTIVTALALQLYFGHLRMADDTSKMIMTNIDNENFHYGYSKDIMTVDSKYKMEQTTWCDKVSSLLNERNLSVVNSIHNKVIEMKDILKSTRILGVHITPSLN